MTNSQASHTILMHYRCFFKHACYDLENLGCNAGHAKSFMAYPLASPTPNVVVLALFERGKKEKA